jgi:bifunctional DNA-binding transcriptional regulator/antitoxin component of YhaV-PrlF toxin-antitoxin module
MNRIVARTRINKKGEIEIPAFLLVALDIKVTDEVIFRIQDGELVLTRAEPSPDRGV